MVEEKQEESFLNENEDEPSRFVVLKDWSRGPFELHGVLPIMDPTLKLRKTVSGTTGGHRIREWGYTTFFK